MSKTEVEFLLTSEVEFLSIQGRSRRAVALKNNLKQSFFIIICFGWEVTRYKKPKFKAPLE